MSDVAKDRTMINGERKERRGFASMTPEKQREIASKGGKAAHQKGTAHEWTSDEARDAGRKGGIASHRRRREQQGGNDMEVSSGREDGAAAPGREGSETPDNWDRGSAPAAGYGEK